MILRLFFTVHIAQRKSVMKLKYNNIYIQYDAYVISTKFNFLDIFIFTLRGVQLPELDKNITCPAVSFVEIGFNLLF